MPVLVGPNGLASNDPYRTLLELSRAASQLDVLYPQDLAHEQAHWTRRIFHELHVAVYRAGEEKDQQSYENAVTTVETFLCDLNDHLFGRETLLGTRLTDADIWLYCLLVRFDQVYAPAFRLHRYRLRDFASIRRYCKNLYAQPLFTATTSFAAISEGYYRGVPFLNRGVVPLGPDDLFLL
ncbi:glutathione binding-like protein [Rathayibacter agropyri]